MSQRIYIKFLNKILIVLIITIIVIISASIWFYMENNLSSKYKSGTIIKTTNITPKDWATYHNNNYGYAVSYPSTWAIGKEPTNGDGVALYDDNDNKVLIYGELIDPEYTTDYIKDGKILLKKPVELTSEREGKLLYIDEGNGKFKYIMYTEIESHRYVIYASVSDVFLKNNRDVLDKIIGSFTPPPKKK